MTNVEVAAVPPEPTTAALLLDQAHNGDSEAFAALLRPLLVPAQRIASSILLNASDAEAAVQDATARAWRALRRLRDPVKLDAWFYTIVGNECRTRLRHPWRRVLPWGVRLDRGPQPDPTGQHDLGEAVRTALLRLDADHRAVLVLRHYHDLSLEQIALQLAVPLGTVKSRLNRASEHLRRALTAQEVTP
jgi:RNA polymerase sigma factor (sigma-70 family)